MLTTQTLKDLFCSMSFTITPQGNETTAEEEKKEKNKNSAEFTSEGPNPELQLQKLPL